MKPTLGISHPNQNKRLIGKLLITAGALVGGYGFIKSAEFRPHKRDDHLAYLMLLGGMGVMGIGAYLLV
jgi:hypothetical protein